jgi:hypothetical protein
MVYEYVQIHRNETFGQAGLKIPSASSATGVDEIELKCVFLERAIVWARMCSALTAIHSQSAGFRPALPANRA